MQIETESLYIRSFNEGDVDDYHRIVSDARVMRFLGDGSTHDRNTATRYVLDCIDSENSGGLARYAVVWKETDKLIGFSGYKYLSGVVDFGYRLAFQFWGKGLATEAGRQVLDYGCNELHLTKITAHALVQNLASIAVLRKLGFEDWGRPPTVDPRLQWFRLGR